MNKYKGESKGIFNDIIYGTGNDNGNGNGNALKSMQRYVQRVALNNGNGCLTQQKRKPSKII